MSCCNKKECPICMDDIMETNCVVTECGHNFHTSCLMKNAAHNGFGCPYCRTVLAEVPEEEDNSDDYSSISEEQEEELYSDFSLRGMRWLFQRSQNEPLDEEEDVQEQEEDNEENAEEQVAKPCSTFITQKLESQGVTMEDLVKCLLSINHEEYEREEEYQQKEDEIFGKFRIIISNYRPNEEQEYHRLYSTPELHAPANITVREPFRQTIMLTTYEHMITEHTQTQAAADSSAQSKEKRHPLIRRESMSI